MEYHQIWVAAVTLLLIEGVGSIPSLYDRILFIYLVLLFKSISKDIPIAVSAADIANNNRVIAKIFISLIVAIGFEPTFYIRILLKHKDLI